MSRPGPSGGRLGSLAAPKHVTERKIERRDPRAVREAAMAKKMAKYGLGPATQPPAPTTQVTTRTRRSTTRVVEPPRESREEEEAGSGEVEEAAEAAEPPPPPARVTQETTTRTRRINKNIRKKNLMGVLHPDLVRLERGEQPPQPPSEPMPEIPQDRRLPPDQFEIYKKWEAYKEYLYEIQMWKKNEVYEPAEIRHRKENEKAMKDAEKNFARDYMMGKFKGNTLAAILMGAKKTKPQKFVGETEEDFQAFLWTQEPEPEPAPAPPGPKPKGKGKPQKKKVKDKKSGLIVRLNARGNVHPDDLYARDGCRPPELPSVLPPHTPQGTLMDPRTFDPETRANYIRLVQFNEHQNKIKAWEKDEPYVPQKEWREHITTVEQNVAKEARRAKTLALAQARAGASSNRLSVPKHAPAVAKRPFLRRGEGRQGTAIKVPTRRSKAQRACPPQTTTQPQLTQAPQIETPQNLWDVSGRRLHFTPEYPPPPLGGLQGYENWQRQRADSWRGTIQPRRKRLQKRIMQDMWGQDVIAVHRYNPNWPISPPDDYDPNVDPDAGIEQEELGVFGPATPPSVYAYDTPPRMATPRQSASPGTPLIPWVTPEDVPPQDLNPENLFCTPDRPILGVPLLRRSPKSGRRRIIRRLRYDDDEERRRSWGHSPSPVLVPPQLAPDPYELMMQPSEPEPEECNIPWVTPEPVGYESPFEQDRFLQLGYRPPTVPRPKHEFFEPEPVLDDELRQALELEEEYMQRYAWMRLKDRFIPSLQLRHPQELAPVRYGETELLADIVTPDLRTLSPEIRTPPTPYIPIGHSPTRPIPYRSEVTQHSLFAYGRGTASPIQRAEAEHEVPEEEWIEEEEELILEEMPPSPVRGRGTPRYLRELRQRMGTMTAPPCPPVNTFELTMPDHEFQELPRMTRTPPRRRGSPTARELRAKEIADRVKEKHMWITDPHKARLVQLMKQHGVPETGGFLMDDQSPPRRRPSRRTPVRLIEVEEEEEIISTSPMIEYESELEPIQEEYEDDSQLLMGEAGDAYMDWLDEGEAILDEAEEAYPFEWLLWDQAPVAPTQPVQYGQAGQELLNEMEFNREEYARLGLGAYGQELMRHMSNWGEPQVVCPPSPRF